MSVFPATAQNSLQEYRQANKTAPDSPAADTEPPQPLNVTIETQTPWTLCPPQLPKMHSHEHNQMVGGNL